MEAKEGEEKYLSEDQICRSQGLATNEGREKSWNVSSRPPQNGELSTPLENERICGRISVYRREKNRISISEILGMPLCMQRYSIQTSGEASS